jgi:hypothetical protein
MRSLSPAMRNAIKWADLYFKQFPDRPFKLGGAYVNAQSSNIRALARRGCCKITRGPVNYDGPYDYVTGPTTGEFVLREDWHPDILHRLANL